MDIPFDTHAEVKKLEAKGFSLEQSEAITDTVRTGITGGIATKADIARLEADIARLGERVGELATKKELAEVKSDLQWTTKIVWLILALLILPWLERLLPSIMPGG